MQASSSRRPSLPRLDTTPGKDKRPLPVAPLASNPAIQRTPRPLPQVPASNMLLSPSLSRRGPRRRTSPGAGRAQIQFDAGSSTWVIKAPITAPQTPTRASRRRSDHLKSYQVTSSNALGAMMGAGLSVKGKERERPLALPVTPPPLPLSPSPTFSYKSYRSEPNSPVIRSRPTVISTPPSPVLKPTPTRRLPVLPKQIQSPQASDTPQSSTAPPLPNSATLTSASTTASTTISRYSFDRSDTRDSGVTNSTSPGSATILQQQASDEHSHPAQELWMLEENQRYSKNWSVHPFGDGAAPGSPDDELGSSIPPDQLIPTFSSSLQGSSESSDDDSDDQGIEYAYYPYRKRLYDPLPPTTAPSSSTPPHAVSSDDDQPVDVYVDDGYSPIDAAIGDMSFSSSNSSVEKPKLSHSLTDHSLNNSSNNNNKRRSLSPMRYARRSSQVYTEADMSHLPLEDLDGEELEEMSFAVNEHLSPSTDSPLHPSPLDAGAPFGVMGQRARSGTESTVTAGLAVSPNERRNSALLGSSGSSSLRRYSSVDTIASSIEMTRKSSVSLTVSAVAPSTRSPTPDLRPNRFIDPLALTDRELHHHHHQHLHPQLALLPHPNSFSLASSEYIQGGSAVGRVGKSARGDQAGFIPLPSSPPIPQLYPPSSAPIGVVSHNGDKEKEKKRKQRGMSLTRPTTPSLPLSLTRSATHSRSKSKSSKSPKMTGSSFIGLGLVGAGSGRPDSSQGREKPSYDAWVQRTLDEEGRPL